METKVCMKCGRELPTSEYYKNRVTTDGLESTCKSCKNEYYKEYNRKKKLLKLKAAESLPFNINEKESGGAGLSVYSARELIEELRNRGYRGKLSYSWDIDIEKI